MDRQEKNRRAKELLEDEVLKECFEKVEQAHIETWKNSNEPEVRETCWHLLQGVEIVRVQLRSMARDLEVEAHNMRINRNTVARRRNNPKKEK